MRGRLKQRGEIYDDSKKREALKGERRSGTCICSPVHKKMTFHEDKWTSNNNWKAWVGRQTKGYQETDSIFSFLFFLCVLFFDELETAVSLQFGTTK